MKLKHVPKHILDKAKSLDNIWARRLPNGDYELSDRATGKVLYTIPKDKIDESAKRLGLEK
jgi:hypothetical protein